MSEDLLERVDFLRLDANRVLNGTRKVALGQFLTPAPVAKLLASMLAGGQPIVSILDAGAGVGTLAAAAVAELCGRSERPKEIQVTAYEVDSHLASYIIDTFKLCEGECERTGVRFTGNTVHGDFIESIASSIGLFGNAERFNCAILNPPYRKISGDSRERSLFSGMGIETTNLYTGFLAVAMRLLEAGGEMVAITPRS